MYKFIGDSILNASFTVQVPKPLDNRTVVANIYELYSIPPAYAYEGMTVANIDNGNIYMLVNKSKIGEKAGWKASYESIQILTCTYAEYKEWQANTNERFQPIDELKEYLHQDTYYYIYEESLPGEEENQEYVKRSDWSDLLNVVSGKASNDALVRTNQEVARIASEYATLEYVQETYAPLSMFDLEDEESFIRANFFTKDETILTFVKFEDLESDSDNFIFVTSARYANDQEEYEQYKQDVAAELANCLKIGEDGDLGTLIVTMIKSREENGQLTTINITPQGVDIDGDPVAKISDVPPHVTLTKEEYDTLVEQDEIDPDVYYHILGDDDAYVLQSQLQESYYTIPAVQSYITGYTYSKNDIDQAFTNIQNGIVTNLVNYYTKSQTEEIFVTKESLEDPNSEYSFVTVVNYNNDLEELDLYKQGVDQFIQNTTDVLSHVIYSESDAELTSLVVQLIKSLMAGGEQLVINITKDGVDINGDPIAKISDVPEHVTLTRQEYDALVQNNEIDPDVYYHVIEDDDTYILRSHLNDYYTKTAIESYITATNYTKAEVDAIIDSLEFYTVDGTDDKFATKLYVQTMLLDYVTLAMLNGTSDIDGQVIFVRQSEYNQYKLDKANERSGDLQNIRDTYVAKNSNATLTSLETPTITHENNTLNISSILEFNNKKVALDEDIPIIQVLTLEEYDEIVKDPDIFYFVYNTDEGLTYATKRDLESYYTKTLMDSMLKGLANHGEGTDEDTLVTLRMVENILEDYTTKDDVDSVKDQIISLLAKRVSQLENLIRRFHIFPTTAYSFVMSPTVSSITTAVRPDLDKPTGPEDYNTVGTLTRPTEMIFTYPLEWEANGLPTIVDSNGYLVGYEINEDTPTVVIDGVTYRICNVELGVDTYTITFQ